MFRKIAGLFCNRDTAAVNENKAVKKDKKDLAIYLLANRKFLFALGTFIVNLKDKFNRYDDIIVYHEDFTDEDMDGLRKIEENIIFVKYTIDDFCEEFGYDKEEVSRIGAIKRYTVLSITRFKMLIYLDKYNTVILFDTDMLLLDDISELLYQDFNVAWKTDKGSTILNKLLFGKYNREKIELLDDYEVYKKAITPNGGFIIVNDNFDYDRAYDVACHYFKKYFTIHPFLMGELTFAYVCFVLDLKLYELDGNVYNVFPDVYTLKAKLVHFYRESKPWNVSYIQYIFKSWVDYYMRYVNISNNPSDSVTLFDDIGEGYVNRAFAHDSFCKLFSSGFKYPKDLTLRNPLGKCVVSFSYNNNVTYDIYLPIKFASVYNCRMWIFYKRDECKTILLDKLNDIIQENTPLEFIKFKGSFGCQIARLGIGEVQKSFAFLYDITSELRQMSDAM